MDDNKPSNQPTPLRGENFAWQLVEALGQGVTIMGADFRFEYVNPAYVRMVGRSQEELVGLGSADVTHPEDYQKQLEARQHRKVGEKSTYESRLLRPDGTIVPVQITGVPRQQGDQIVGSFAIITDLTQQKQSEAALRQSEERYRRIVEDQLDLIVRWLPDGTRLFVNEAYCQQFGQTKEEAIGSSFFPLVHDADRDSFITKIHSLTPESPAIEYEQRSFLADGSVGWHRWLDRAMFDENGRIIELQSVGRDITKQKQIEAERDAIFQRNLAIVQAFGEIVYEWLPLQDIVKREGDYERILGYTEAEIGKDTASWTSRIHPDDVDKVQREVAAASQERRNYVMEYRFRRKDGRYIWMQDNGVLFHNEQGELERVIGIFRNINRRKQIEAALRESEGRFRSTLDNMQEGYQIIGFDWRYRYVNNAVTEQGKQSKEALIGHTMMEMYPGIENTPLFEVLKHCMTERVATQMENEFTFPDGSIGWFELSIQPVPEGLVIISFDITERKRAQIAAHQSETRLQHIIDTVPEGVVLLTADGTVHLTNPVADRYLQILWVEREDGRLAHLGNQPLQELFTSPPQGLWHEFSFNDYAFETIARPIENSATTTGWVLVLRDVTQEREIQRRVQQQERLAAVGQLAAGIAHDFNNILAVITLYSQLIARTADLPPRIHEQATTIEQQSRRASDLIQQILDFSRQTVLERRLVDLLPFMKDLVRLLKRTLPEHLQIELDYAEGIYALQADPSRIQQIIMNLAVNARDAMPEGGQLHIKLAHWQTDKTQSPPIPDMPPAHWIQIEVSDSGSGIPASVLPHIFDPFFTTKDIGKGSGLGLAQVYGIVQQHNGYIDVKTEAGQGTTFSLYLPTADVDQNTLSSSDTISLRIGHGQVILVVEDNSATRKALIDSLRLMNYQVLETENGREALTILANKGNEIDLVLSDIVMPDMGGIALLHAMRQQKIALPTVLLTGHPLDREMKNLQSLGLSGLMSKPPNLVDLSHLLARILVK